MKQVDFLSFERDRKKGKIWNNSDWYKRRFYELPWYKTH